MKKKDEIDEALIKAYLNNKTVNPNLYKATSSEYYYVTENDYTGTVEFQPKKKRSLKDIFSFKFVSKNERLEKEINQYMQDLINPNRMYERLGVDIICLRLGKNLVYFADPEKDGPILPQLAAFRQRMVDKLGYIIPNVRVQDDSLLNDNEFAFLIRGKQVYKGELLFEKRSKLNVDQIFSELEEVCIKYVHQIFEKTNILKIIELVKSENPTLINDLVPLFLSATDLKTIFANLVSRRISIKDIIYIFEILNDHARYIYDVDELTNIVEKELNFDW